jgi:hypothetical protein
VSVEKGRPVTTRTALPNTTHSSGSQGTPRPRHTAADQDVSDADDRREWGHLDPAAVYAADRAADRAAEQFGWHRGTS